MAEVKVIGLRQFVAALKEVSDKYPRQVQRAGFKAAKAIATEAKANAAQYGGNGMYGPSAATIRAFSRGLVASITAGGGSTPYFWGAEFGAKRRTGWYAPNRYANSKGRQWLPWRGNQWGGWSGGPGYMINPAVRDKADEALEQYSKELDRLYRKAFPG